MDYFILAVISLLASGLTFFSGFGLGTILLPVFSFFFPIEMAIAMTAVVHFLNNVFKLILVYKNIDRNVLWRFGLPALVFALIGAYWLDQMSVTNEIYSWQISGKIFNINSIKLVIGSLLVFFAFFEIIPKLKNLQFDRKYLTLGGILSGFFGGLSGLQGALRSAFISKIGLSKESFIATGIAIACIIDISRLGIYSDQISRANFSMNQTYIILTAIGSAFVGAYVGSKLVTKITIDILQKIIAFMLIVFGVFLALGIL